MPVQGSGRPETLRAGSRGQIRSTGVCILLTVVTFGIYPIVWFIKTNGALNGYWRSLGAR